MEKIYKTDGEELEAFRRVIGTPKEVMRMILEIHDLRGQVNDLKQKLQTEREKNNA